MRTRVSGMHAVTPLFVWQKLLSVETRNPWASLFFPVAHVDKTLDLDYFVPPSVREERLTPSPSTTTTPPQRSATIKTMDLFPGSTTFLADDPKPPVDPVPNFSFMNAKALMSPLQFNGNRTGQPTTLFWSDECFLFGLHYFTVILSNTTSSHFFLCSSV